MKKQLLNSLKVTSLFVLLALLFVSSVQLTAQDAKEAPKNIFIEVACFKSKAPGVSEMFKKYGKAWHEELIRQGVLINWAFFAVDFPNGEDCECNYREVRVFTDMKTMDKLSSPEYGMEVAQKVFPDEDLELLMKSFRDKIDFRHSTVYELKDELIPGPSNSNMIVVNFMDVKPGMGSEYEKMESEVFKPVHSASQKAGHLVDWSLWERVLPYGSSFDHDYLTVDVWGSYENMAKADSGASWKAVYPDKNPADIYKKMAETRDLLKAEIWINVARAEPNKKPDASSSNN